MSPGTSISVILKVPHLRNSLIALALCLVFLDLPLFDVVLWDWLINLRVDLLFTAGRLKMKSCSKASVKCQLHLWLLKKTWSQVFLTWDGWKCRQKRRAGIDLHYSLVDVITLSTCYEACKAAWLLVPSLKCCQATLKTFHLICFLAWSERFPSSHQFRQLWENRIAFPKKKQLI